MKCYSEFMKILAIETSCDETGIAILETASSGVITLLGNALASQIELHAQYGGVFPVMAKRAHAEKIVPLIMAAFAPTGLLHAEEFTLGTDNRGKIATICNREEEMVSGFIELFSTYQKPEIDYIAVTVGPGLEPALWVGINAAKMLATVWNIPVIPVNHMEGHIVTAAVTELGLETKVQEQKHYEFKNLEFPLLALLVSGGHTELVLTKKYGEYEKIGQTRDDAVGEAFDKVARMLGLPYPGGPAVSKMAREFRSSGMANQFLLPRPMLHSGDYDFSFSGIKTAVLYTIRDLQHELTDEDRLALAAAFEDAVVEVLIKKTIRAAEEFHIQTIVVGGGVAGNTYLREQLTLRLGAQLPNVTVLFPEPWLATDNAVMIGLAALARIQSDNAVTQDAMTLRANGNLSLGSAD